LKKETQWDLGDVAVANRKHVQQENLDGATANQYTKTNGLLTVLELLRKLKSQQKKIASSEGEIERLRADLDLSMEEIWCQR